MVTRKKEFGMSSMISKVLVPKANFELSLPKRVVRLKTMRQLRIEAAIPPAQGDNPYLADMLENPMPTKPLEPLQPEPKPEYIFGRIGPNDGKERITPSRVRFDPPDYMFLHGRRVQRGASR